MENKKINSINSSDRVKLECIKLVNTIVNTSMGSGMVLDATFTINKKNGAIAKMHYPRIALPFNMYQLPIIQPGVCSGIIEANFGFGNTMLLPDENQNVFEYKEIKPANAVEMTLDDIEKKLGHPVKIVKEK